MSAPPLSDVTNEPVNGACENACPIATCEESMAVKEPSHPAEAPSAEVISENSCKAEDLASPGPVVDEKKNEDGDMDDNSSGAGDSSDIDDNKKEDGVLSRKRMGC